MRFIRRMIAVWVCKFLSFAGKLGGKMGTSAPGKFALKIYPDLLKDLSGQVKKSVIAVCGTNGKTTTNNLIYSILKSQSKNVVCNNIGANMLPGIACSFALSANIFGKLNADYATIEIDEATCRLVFPSMKPDIIVLTNLFRDQIDRYGEVDSTSKLLDEAFNMAPDALLVLNADDPVTSILGKNRKTVYIGVDENTGGEPTNTKEGQTCPLCGASLDYEYYHYSQLGKYNCPSCDFARPCPDYRITNVDSKNGLKFDADYLLSGDKTNKHFDVNYRGFYNIYNIMMAFSACAQAGADISAVDKVLDAYKPQIGRMEEFTIDGKTVILNLSKNPAGFNQGIATVLADNRPKDVCIVVNDKPSDGIDVSWLWDTDFERLNIPEVESYTVSGMRCYDLGLRLKYSGFDMDKVSVEPDLNLAINKTVNNEARVKYFLVNYTAIFTTQDILKKMQVKGNEN